MNELANCIYHCQHILKYYVDVDVKVLRCFPIQYSKYISPTILNYWKRRIATTLQRENALFNLNSSAHVLSTTNRTNMFDP